MVNVGLNPSSLVGLALVGAGAALYFLRSFRPGLARDYDIFFAAVSLLCGGILFFQGWRQDPILQFGQFLLAGSAVFFAYESIRLRGVATEQAKRTTPVVDDDRPVSRVYKAELDDYNAIEERPAARRIRSARDSRAAQADEYDDVRRRPASGRNARTGSSDTRPPRKRRSAARPDRSSQRADDRYADPDVRRYSREEPASSLWDDEDASRSYDAPPRPPRSDSAASKPKRPRPQGSQPSRVEPTPADYVDYQPIDYSGDEADNSSNFD